MREVRRALVDSDINISDCFKKKNRSLVLNGHETFFLLKKRIYRSKSQAIICKSRPYDSFTAFLHHNITLNSHPWLLVWYSELLSGCLQRASVGLFMFDKLMLFSYRSTLFLAGYSAFKLQVSMPQEFQFHCIS